MYTTSIIHILAKMPTDIQYQELEEEQSVVREKIPGAEPDPKKQTELLNAAEEVLSTNEALHEHLLQNWDELQSHFDQAPKMKQNTKIFQISMELLEIEIAGYTEVVNNDDT